MMCRVLTMILLLSSLPMVAGCETIKTTGGYEYIYCSKHDTLETLRQCLAHNKHHERVTGT